MHAVPVEEEQRQCLVEQGAAGLLGRLDAGDVEVAHEAGVDRGASALAQVDAESGPLAVPRPGLVGVGEQCDHGRTQLLGQQLGAHFQSHPPGG
ncbi:hypothetical protein ACWV95_13940 [Streptomyces albus]